MTGVAAGVASGLAAISPGGLAAKAASAVTGKDIKSPAQQALNSGGDGMSTGTAQAPAGKPDGGIGAHSNGGTSGGGGQSQIGNAQDAIGAIANTMGQTLDDMYRILEELKRRRDELLAAMRQSHQNDVAAELAAIEEMIARLERAIALVEQNIKDLPKVEART